MAHTTTADSKQTTTTDVTQAPTIATSILSLPIRAQFSSTLFINDHDLITGIYQGSIDVTSLTKHTGRIYCTARSEFCRVHRYEKDMPVIL